MNVAKIPQNIKNKSLLSREKKYYRMIKNAILKLQESILI